MFNKNFYPTPPNIIEKMAQGLDLKGAFVLEPSAGKGDIATYLRNQYARVDCIELDAELADFLRAKNFRILGSNFLNYTPARLYNYIIMNPPFDAGAAHLLHAWNIADGATIVCLLNAETVENAYTDERQKLAKIIAEHGTIEHLGKPFASGAERATSVEVVMITLHKPASDKAQLFNLKKLKEEDLGAPYSGTEIATKDEIFNRVTCLKKAIDAMREMSRQSMIFDYYRQAAGLTTYGSRDDDYLRRYAAKGTAEYNECVAELHKRAWSGFMGESIFQKYIVGNVKHSFEAQKKAQQEVEFNEENIHAFLDIIVGTRSQIIERAIGESFDFLCSFDEKHNKLHVSGWKTNDAYKVNKKLVVPAGCEDWYWRKDHPLDNFEKCLCFITGQDYTHIESIASVLTKFKGNPLDLYGEKHETTHFIDVKFYKKGTVHLTFREDYTWAQFNQIAAKGKNWIGY
jgi:hypothetical protein